MLRARLIEHLEAGFRGARIVIIGGAGAIGREAAAQAALLGARVVAASRGGQAIEPPPPAPGVGEIVSAALDIAAPESIAAFAAWAEQSLGGLDVLILSAGVTRTVPPGDLACLDDALIDQMMAANATGHLRAIRDLAPLLRKGQAPAIINVSSAAARTGQGSNLAYVGAKAAMEAISIGLAKALAPEIRVVNISPSALATAFVPDRGEDFLARASMATPLKRLATAAEVADAALIAARLLPMTTGEVIRVDGGRTL